MSIYIHVVKATFSFSLSHERLRYQSLCLLYLQKDDNNIHCESLILLNYMCKYASAEDMAGM